MAEWWNKRTRIPYNDPSFQKIIDFYLFNCPCEIESKSKDNSQKYNKVSKRAESLREQGWIEGKLNTLLAAMKHTKSGHLEYHIVNTSTSIENEVKRIEKESTLSDEYFEMIVITERSDMNKTGSIFYYIRNALAHGSFSYIDIDGKKIYYFECSKDNTVKAQIRLREESLLKWIKDFRMSPKKLRIALEEERKQKRKNTKSKKAA